MEASDASFCLNDATRDVRMSWRSCHFLVRLAKWDRIVVHGAIHSGSSSASTHSRTPEARAMGGRSAKSIDGASGRQGWVGGVLVRVEGPVSDVLEHGIEDYKKAGKPVNDVYGHHDDE